MPEPPPTIIQLQEFRQDGYISSSSSSSSDEIEFNRKPPHHHVHVSSSSSSQNNNIPDLIIPLTQVQLTLPDALFSATVLCFVVMEVVLDLTLLVWHATTGHNWASCLTGLFVGCGGVALLSQFWGVKLVFFGILLSRDQLTRIYENPDCVRHSVNSFPWLFTVITSYQSTSTCLRSYHQTTPFLIHKHVKLQELTRSLLKIQTLSQAAPLSVVQLVVLLEDLDDVSLIKATTTICSIIVNLTLMMVANLPLKSDVSESADERLPRAAYSPYSRLFVGLRMICNFASRTMALSLYISSFRCSVFQFLVPTPITLTDPASTSPPPPTNPVLPHIIPISVLLIPRILFTIASYIKSRLSSSFPDLLLMYTASIFFPFGDVLWLYVYVTLETLVFMVFGFVFGELVVGDSSACLGFGVNGIVYLIVFVGFFGIVPCVVPWAMSVVGRNRQRGSSSLMRRGASSIRRDGGGG